MRKLPAGWRWVRLSDVCEFIYGSSLPQHLRENGEVPVYGSNGIVGIHKEAMTQGETIIIGRKGSIGEVHFSEVSCWPIDTTYYIDKNYTDENLRWLTFWLKALNLRKLNKASGVPGLNRDDAYALEIPLPPLDEQRRIVAILNEKMAAIEQARVAAKAQLEAAQALPAAYLREVFESAEAEKWPKKRLGDVNQLLPAKSIALAGDTEVNVITTACLTEAGFNPEGIKSSKMWSYDVSECVVSKGEILIARSNTTELVGRVAMFDGVPPGTVASDLTIRIWPSQEKYVPSFLASYLSSLYLNGYWRDRAGGASQSMKKITRGQISNIQVPIPDIETQKRIVALLNEKINKIKQVNKGLKSQFDAINALPAALLHQAFNGDL